MAPRFRCVRSLLFSCLLALGLAGASAQTPTPLLKPDEAPFNFYERGPYRPDVPRPVSLIG